MPRRQRHKGLASGRFEHKRDPVDAMPHSGGRRAIIKDMTQMAAAAPAVTFGAGHEKLAVNTGFDRICLRLPKTGPAGAAVKFML